MALKITAVTRSHPAPCNHWNVTIQNDILATSVTLAGIYQPDLQSQDTWPDAPWWCLLALLWLRARIAAGFTIANSLNLEIVG